MTESEAEEVMLMLKAAFPRANDNLDERMIAARSALYRSELLGWRVNVTREAVREYLRVGKWFPTIADLRAHYDAADRPRALFAQPAIPPLGGTTATKDRTARAFEAVRKILNCKHPPETCTATLCIHRRDYEEGFAG